MKKIKPSGYWTYERCKKEALKYKKRAHLQKANGGVYSAMQKNGWLDELTSHMAVPTNKKINWSYAECKSKALEYDSLLKFRTEQKRMYIAILKNNWKDLLQHMEYIFRENGYWTYERCKEEALKYKTKKEFRENSHAYDVINKNKWWDELCNHITSPQRNWGYYTYDNCKKLALQYKDRKEFDENEPLAYRTALKNKWYDLFKHMNYRTSLKDRIIYAFEFSDNSVYVGLTYDISKRKYAHLNNDDSLVYRHISKTNSSYVLKILTDNPVNIKNAGEVENYYIEQYRKNGWNIINVAKAGGLGGAKIYWTLNKCKKLAAQYKKMSEFRKNTKTYILKKIRKNGWWDLVTADLEKDVLDLKPMTYWNIKENCKNEALKHKTRSEFKKNNSGAYKGSLRNKWLDEFFKK